SRHNGVNRSASSLTITPAATKGFRTAAADDAEINQPSKATVAPTGKLTANQSAYSAACGTFSFTHSNPLPASCSPACTKYRESFHRPANDWVMASVPAEPVKPAVQAMHL